MVSLKAIPKVSIYGEPCSAAELYDRDKGFAIYRVDKEFVHVWTQDIRARAGGVVFTLKGMATRDDLKAIEGNDPELTLYDKNGGLVWRGCIPLTFPASDGLPSSFTLDVTQPVDFSF